MICNSEICYTLPAVRLSDSFFSHYLSYLYVNHEKFAFAIVEFLPITIAKSYLYRAFYKNFQHSFCKFQVFHMDKLPLIKHISLSQVCPLMISFDPITLCNIQAICKSLLSRNPLFHIN